MIAQQPLPRQPFSRIVCQCGRTFANYKQETRHREYFPRFCLPANTHVVERAARPLTLREETAMAEAGLFGVRITTADIAASLREGVS